MSEKRKRDEGTPRRTLVVVEVFEVLSVHADVATRHVKRSVYVLKIATRI